MKNGHNFMTILSFKEQFNMNIFKDNYEEIDSVLYLNISDEELLEISEKIMKRNHIVYEELAK